MREKKIISTRIGYLVINLIDRKNNNWPEKIFENKLKTSEQVHEEHLLQMQGVPQQKQMSGKATGGSGKGSDQFRWRRSHRAAAPPGPGRRLMRHRSRRTPSGR